MDLQNESILYKILIKIFVFLFLSILGFIAFSLSGRFVEGLIAVTILAVCLFSWYVQPKNTILYILLLIAVSFGIKYYAILNLLPTPVQDFKTILDAAKGMLVNDYSFNQMKYFHDWAYQTIYVVYEWFILTFNNDIQTIKLVNVIASVGVNLLIYCILKGSVPERHAKAIAMFFAFMPFPVIVNTLLSNQPMAAFLSYLGLYLFVKPGGIIKNRWVRIVLAGILVSMGNLMRPEGIVFVTAILVWILLEWIRELNLRATAVGIIRVFAFIAPYLLVGALASQLVIMTGTNPNGLVNNNIYWKFTVGFNHQSKGMWNRGDYDWLAEQEEKYPLKPVKDIQMPRIEYRIYTYPERLPRLFADKSYIFWAFPRLSPAFEYMKSDDEEKIMSDPRFSHLFEYTKRSDEDNEEEIDTERTVVEENNEEGIDTEENGTEEIDIEQFISEMPFSDLLDYVEASKEEKRIINKELRQVREERTYYIDYLNKVDIWMFLILMGLSVPGILTLGRRRKKEEDQTAFEADDPKMIKGWEADAPASNGPTTDGRGKYDAGSGGQGTDGLWTYSLVTAGLAENKLAARVPELDVPELSMPELSVPEPSITELSVPELSVPEPSALEPKELEPNGQKESRKANAWRIIKHKTSGLSKHVVRISRKAIGGASKGLKAIGRKIMDLTVKTLNIIKQSVIGQKVIRWAASVGSKIKQSEPGQKVIKWAANVRGAIKRKENVSGSDESDSEINVKKEEIRKTIGRIITSIKAVVRKTIHWIVNAYGIIKPKAVSLNKHARRIGRRAIDLASHGLRAVGRGTIHFAANAKKVISSLILKLKNQNQNIKERKSLKESVRKRRDKRRGRKANGVNLNLVFAYMIFVTAIIYMLIEVQPRYVYFIQPAVAILAAYGLQRGSDKKAKDNSNVAK